MKKYESLDIMSKLGTSYIPGTLVWTKISLGKYFIVCASYPQKSLYFCELTFVLKYILPSSASTSTKSN